MNKKIYLYLYKEKSIYVHQIIGKKKLCKNIECCVCAPNVRLHKNKNKKKTKTSAYSSAKFNEKIIQCA